MRPRAIVALILARARIGIGEPGEVRLAVLDGETIGVLVVEVGGLALRAALCSVVVRKALVFGAHAGTLCGRPRSVGWGCRKARDVQSALGGGALHPASRIHTNLA